MAKTDFDKDSIVEYLMNLASKQHLIDRAMKGCDAWFENEEDWLIDEWSSKDLTKEFFAHSLTFKHADWDLVYISTKLKLLDADRREVGHYHLITTLDGEVDDDYLVFDRVIANQ